MAARIIANHTVAPACQPSHCAGPAVPGLAAAVKQNNERAVVWPGSSGCQDHPFMSYYAKLLQVHRLSTQSQWRKTFLIPNSGVARVDHPGGARPDLMTRGGVR